MAKPIMIDGKAHRIRRGKLVEIPAEWVGKTVSRQTILKRPSKSTNKERTTHPLGGFCGPGHPSGWAPRKTLGKERNGE